MDTFYPKFTQEIVDNILDELVDKISDKYRRPGRMIDVDIDEIQWDDEKNSLSALIVVYVNGDIKADKIFKFTAYDEYFDEDDFDSHIYRKIDNFIQSL